MPGRTVGSAALPWLPVGGRCRTAGPPVTGRALVNAGRRTDRVPVPPGREVTDHHRRVPGYRPTPLRELPDLATELGLNAVGIKDESDRLGLPAFKVLGASWAVERVLRRHPRTGTLVAASAGNHGRAVARSAAQRGLAAQIFLPEGTAPHRADAIAAEGASVHHVAGRYDDAVRTARQAAAAPGSVLLADVSDDPDAVVPQWVAEGYVTLFREAAAQFAPQVVLVPMGVGALASAAVRWAAHEGGGAHVIGVEPVTAACVTAALRVGHPVTVTTPGTGLAGLDCGTASAVAWPVLRDGLVGTVTVDDAEVHDAMRALAGSGLALGDCGAAPLAALRRLATDDGCAPLRTTIGLSPETTVLCIGTEGPTDPATYRSIVGPPPG